MKKLTCLIFLSGIVSTAVWSYVSIDNSDAKEYKGTARTSSSRMDVRSSAKSLTHNICPNVPCNIEINGVGSIEVKNSSDIVSIKDGRLSIK